MKEEFIEEGIVRKINGKYAEVLITNKDECKECSAKLFCKPSSDFENSIEVVDPFGVAPGDVVRFSVNGGNILKASSQLYLVPLVLFIAGILAGYSIFQHFELKELFSFLTGVSLAGIYYSFHFLFRKNDISILPVIISVKKIIEA
jgi:sigma-E factor negative regulatory protein RseC